MSINAEQQEVFFYPSLFRTVVINGERVFIAKDICNILNMKWSGAQTLDMVPEEYKGLFFIRTQRGTQETWYIKTLGLFLLVMSSRRPEGKSFWNWLCKEGLLCLNIETLEAAKYE